MLRPLTFVAVGQQDHEPGCLPPLVLGSHDELVDGDLGAVDEVTELRFPGHEGVLVHDRVPVLEAQRRVLGQQRVVDEELALAGVEVGERRVPLAGVVVHEHGVPVGERAPP